MIGREQRMGREGWREGGGLSGKLGNLGANKAGLHAARLAEGAEGEGLLLV